MKRIISVIIAYHDDYCTIHRDMIAEKLLARENGIYRRSIASTF